MVRSLTAVGLGSLLVALVFATTPVKADLACTFDQMQIIPASVIDPCSQLLDANGVSDSDKAQAFFVRGRAYARTGRTTLAAQDFDVALKLAPERSDIWVSRAHAEAKLGRSNAAWSDLQRALTLNPKDARAWFAEGQFYEDAGDLDQAMLSFDRALAEDPAEPYSLLNRSDIFMFRHQVPEAMADATALVNIPSAVINKLGYVDVRGVLTNFHVVALNHRSAFYERIGDQPSADRDLESAIAEQPSAGTFRQRAGSLLQHGQVERALKDADEAVRLDPADGDVQYLRGVILGNLSRYAEGLEAFDKAIAAHKDFVVSRVQFAMDYQMRARMLRGLGKTDEALEAMNKAVAISPEVKENTLRSMSLRGYWRSDGTGANGDVLQAALRACMLDKDCA